VNADVRDTLGIIHREQDAGDLPGGILAQLPLREFEQVLCLVVERAITLVFPIGQRGETALVSIEQTVHAVDEHAPTHRQHRFELPLGLPDGQGGWLELLFFEQGDLLGRRSFRQDAAGPGDHLNRDPSATAPYSRFRECMFCRRNIRIGTISSNRLLKPRTVLARGLFHVATLHRRNGHWAITTTREVPMKLHAVCCLVALMSLCCNPSLLCARSKDVLSVDEVVLSLEGRNVLKLDYTIGWHGMTGANTSLINGTSLKILSIWHKLEDKDLIEHDPIFQDHFPMDVSLTESFQARSATETLRLTKAVEQLSRSITVVDVIYGNSRKRQEAACLERQLAYHLAPDKSCTKTPEMSIISGVHRLTADEISTSNLGVTVPAEGNYWDVREPLALSTLCWLKRDLYNNGTNEIVRDGFGEVDLRYVVLVTLEDASGFRYTIEFTTKKLTRYDEVAADARDGSTGAIRRNEVVGFSGIEIE